MKADLGTPFDTARRTHARHVSFDRRASRNFFIRCSSIADSVVTSYIKTPKKHGELPKSPKNLGSYYFRRQRAVVSHPSAVANDQANESVVRVILRRAPARGRIPLKWAR